MSKKKTNELRNNFPPQDLLKNKSLLLLDLIAFYANSDHILLYIIMSLVDYDFPFQVEISDPKTQSSITKLIAKLEFNLTGKVHENEKRLFLNDD